MSMGFTNKNITADLCKNCPARNGEIFTAKLRGSSFRGRLIEDGEEFDVDTSVIMVGEFTVATVQIANMDDSAAEQDDRVLKSSFELHIAECKGPDAVSTEGGVYGFCAPINQATDNFISTNYQPE